MVLSLIRIAGCPIRKSPDQSLLTAPRGNIGVRPVLHRLLAPRHPPCALTCFSSRTLVKMLPLTFPYPIFKVQTNNPLQLYTLAWIDGGAERSRTAGLLLARQALSQLSYSPIFQSSYPKRYPGGPKWTRTTDLTLIRRAL